MLIILQKKTANLFCVGLDTANKVWVGYSQLFHQHCQRCLKYKRIELYTTVQYMYSYNNTEH